MEAWQIGVCSLVQAPMLIPTQTLNPKPNPNPKPLRPKPPQTQRLSVEAGRFIA